MACDLRVLMLPLDGTRTLELVCVLMTAMVRWHVSAPAADAESRTGLVR
jgi:hypothetical protein